MAGLDNGEKMNLSDSRKLFKVTYTIDPVSEESMYKLVLKETNADFGHIREYQDELTNRCHQFKGYSWMGNDTDLDGQLVMNYPTRRDQFQEVETDYLDLELESGFNQALLDAGHFYMATRTFVFPDYSPLSLKR
jgi:hypothetical protein